MQAGDQIKLKIENQEHYSHLLEKLNFDPYLLTGKIIRVSSDIYNGSPRNFYLVEIDSESKPGCYCDIETFYDYEIELDIQRKREETLSELFS